MKNKTYEKAYTKVVDFLMDACEKENRLPWDSGLLCGRLEPVYYKSGRAYNKINRLILATFRRGTGEWVTFKGAQKLGGNIKRGEHGIPVIGWYEYNKTQDRYAVAADHNTDDDLVWFPKVSTVFEVGVQTEKLVPKRKIEKRANPPLAEADRFIEAFFKTTELGREVRLGTAAYYPGTHKVGCPAIEDFKSSSQFYSTMFHEMVHSTMVKMGRKEDSFGGFGSEVYSKEEVVAEVGALLLCEHFGIASETQENSATYIQHWSKKLRENPDWLVGGASAAEKAVAYMLEAAGFADVTTDSAAGTAEPESSGVSTSNEHQAANETIAA